MVCEGREDSHRTRCRGGVFGFVSYIKSALHRNYSSLCSGDSAFWSVLCGLIIPMQLEFILKLDRPHWQIIRQTRLLGAVSGEGKKVLTLGLTDKGKLDKVIKSSETDAAHQA